jgi:hypothetical protein
MATGFIWLKIRTSVLRTKPEISWKMWRLLAQLKFCFMQLFTRKFDKTVHPSDRLELLGSM